MSECSHERYVEMSAWHRDSFNLATSEGATYGGYSSILPDAMHDWGDGLNVTICLDCGKVTNVDLDELNEVINGLNARHVCGKLSREVLDANPALKSRRQRNVPAHDMPRAERYSHLSPEEADRLENIEDLCDGTTDDDPPDADDMAFVKALHAKHCGGN